VQNYAFLFKLNLFQFLFDVFYEAIPAVRCNLPKKIGRISSAIRAKKNPFHNNETDFKYYFFMNYNSNNNVKETLSLIELILAPSVSPWLKNPCWEFLSADEYDKSNLVEPKL
jgi:hypothetical protein